MSTDGYTVETLSFLPYSCIACNLNLAVRPFPIALPTVFVASADYQQISFLVRLRQWSVTCLSNFTVRYTALHHEHIYSRTYPHIILFHNVLNYWNTGPMVRGSQLRVTCISVCDWDQIKRSMWF